MKVVSGSPLDIGDFGENRIDAIKTESKLGKIRWKSTKKNRKKPTRYGSSGDPLFVDGKKPVFVVPAARQN